MSRLGVGLQRRLDLQRAHSLLLGVRARERHGAGGVGGVVQQGIDVVDEERVQALGDLLLVGEGEGALEGDPVEAGKVSLGYISGGKVGFFVSRRYVHALVAISFLEYKKEKEKRKGLQSYQTPFRCIGPILTTAFCFSALRMPSRRPRVIWATLSSLVPLIIWLSGRY
jgi:hypothetical protein